MGRQHAPRRQRRRDPRRPAERPPARHRHRPRADRGRPDPPHRRRSDPRGIPNADGLAPLARVAERLYTTRDPNAYGKVGALLYAHDEAPVERVVAVASYLMGPKCGPAEHAAEASPACWFNIRLEGRRVSLDRMRLDRW